MWACMGFGWKHLIAPNGLLSGERENVFATPPLSFKIATKGKSYFLPETVLVYQDASEMQSQTALAGDLV